MMKRTYYIALTNCDCCNDTLANQHDPRRNLFGPRCRGCGQVLGWMQWTFEGTIRALSAYDALAEYKKNRKSKLRNHKS